MKIKKMGLADKFSKMGIYMKAISKIIRKVVMEDIFLKMEVSMKETGKIINEMEKGSKFMNKEIFMRVNGKMDINVDMENTNSRKGIQKHMREII